jgi:hypothetical protein
MKQNLKLLIAFLCGAIFFSGISYAANTLTATVVDLKILVNGQEKVLSEKPVVINNRTYLPVRDIGTITGYEVAYEQGVISLNSSRSNTENQSKTDDQSNSTSDKPRFEFKKLPITVTKGDISVTVNSISRGEYSTTDFSVTIVNNTGEDLSVNYTSFVLGANYDVPGKKYTTHGTISGETEFSKPVKAGSTVTGTIRKGVVDEDTENVIFHLQVGVEYFSFYIDTKGIL